MAQVPIAVTMLMVELMRVQRRQRASAGSSHRGDGPKVVLV